MSTSNPPLFRRPRRAGLAVALVLIVTAAQVGCDKKGDGSDAAGVSGKVMYANKPVTGSVVFVGSDGKESVPALIGADGSYKATDLQPGEYKIKVVGMAGAAAPPKSKQAAPEMGAGAGGGNPPPAKYGSVDTSGLTFSYKGGKQTNDITLTD